MLLFHRADGDPEPVGNFLVREQFDLPQEQHGAAALRELGDGLLELLQFLAGHDLLHHARGGGGRAVRFSGPGGKRRDAPPLELVDGEPARRRVEHGLGDPRRVVLHLRVDPQVGIMRDVLGLGRVAQQPRQVTPQRRQRGAVQARKIAAIRAVAGFGREWALRGHDQLFRQSRTTNPPVGLQKD